MRLRVLGVLAAMICGCADQAQVVEPWAQSDRGFGAFYARALVVLVVDDAPGPEGEALREHVTLALHDSLMTWIDGAHPPNDPAVWRPEDWTVVVAPPSGEGSPRLIGPHEVARLAYRTKHASSAGVELLASAVDRVISSTIAEPGEPYRPLEVAHRVVSLLAGAREPTDEGESAVVALLAGGYTNVYVAIATTRDDESPLDVSAYGLPPMVDSRASVQPTLVLPRSRADFGCSAPPDPSTRLGAWAARVTTAETLSWPCDPPDRRLFAQSCFCSFGFPDCLSRPIAVSPDGRARCLVTVEADEASCPPERGWLDPVGDGGRRAPRQWQSVHASGRVCEVAQLEGAALDACRTTLPCDGCPSGWCVTEVPQLSHDRCPVGELDDHLRFVGGSVAGANGLFRVICELEP